jgi:hypothetical protein
LIRTHVLCTNSSSRALIAAALLVTSSCRGVPPDAVPGTYVMNHGRASDTLVVRAGGTYIRRYAAPGQPPAIDSGTWSVDTASRGQMLGFDRFPTRWDAETPFASDRDTVRGLWLTIAHRDVRGRVRLVVDDDLDWAYVRSADQ